MKNTNQLKRIGIVMISILLDIAAISLVVYLSLPLARWYWEKLPVRGTDIFNTASYVGYLMRNFITFFGGWKDMWYEGNPFGLDYPFLHFYLILPFAKFFGLIRGIEAFSLFSIFVFLFFSYLTFFQLSRNKVISAILTLGIAWGLNLYRVLIWGGGIPYFATQTILPIGFYLFVKFQITKDNKWLYALALAIGLGMHGHPQPFISFIVPLIIVNAILWVRDDEKPFNRNKFVNIILFLVPAFLIAFPSIHSLVSVVFATFTALVPGFLGIKPLGEGAGGPGSLARSKGSFGAGSVLEAASQEIIDWARQQFTYVFSDTNSILWILAGASVVIFIISLVFANKRLRELVSILGPSLGLFWVVFYVYLLSIGVNLYHGGWYKVYWPTPFMIGYFVSFLWGRSFVNFSRISLFNKEKTGKLFWGIFVGVITTGVIVYAYLYFPKYSKDVITRLDRTSNVSSAFPGVLNVLIDRNDQEKLKKSLIPSFIKGDDRNYRLYTIDATINVWWSALFELPLARGYIDPPDYRSAGSLFWLNSAVSPSPNGPSSSLVEDWKTPEDIAKNNMLFLLDWFSIKYFEGNHASQTSSNLAGYVTGDEFIKQKETVSVPGSVGFYVNDWGGEEWQPDNKTDLNYYEVKDEFVSPILSTTNASTIAVIGDENAYDVVTRLFAINNYNSRKLITVRGPKYIDDWSLSDFNNFDALILYNYDYHSHDNAWGLIEKYLLKGGKVFVETGGEVKESNSINLPQRFPKELPSFFPIVRTIREDMGKDWALEVNRDAHWSEVDYNQFSPLDIDGKPWNISHPASAKDIRRDAKIILSNKETPVLASQEVNGGGKLIWSGLNFPYHALRNLNREETKLFTKILGDLINFDAAPSQPSTVRWLSPGKGEIIVQDAKGVLLKEQYYPGWEGFLTKGSKVQKIKLYSAGPSSPGFIYARVPKDGNENFKVIFRYSGDNKTKLYYLMSFIVALFIIDYLVGGYFLVKLVSRLKTSTKLKLGKWWGKTDEY